MLGASVPALWLMLFLKQGECWGDGVRMGYPKFHKSWVSCSSYSVTPFPSILDPRMTHRKVVKVRTLDPGCLGVYPSLASYWLYFFFFLIATSQMTTKLSG